MRAGAFEVRTLLTGFFRLDGGAMFGVVPKVLWEKTNPADDKNRILMALRCLLIEGQGRKILVDSGIGRRWNEKQQAIYAIDHSQHDLQRALKGAGLSASEITDVVLTHLHFDHVGGVTGEGEGLTFPNASVHVQQANIDQGCCPTEKDRASFVKELISPLQASGKLVLHDGPYQLIKGVEVLVTNGHTPGHQVVKVGEGNETVVFCGDTIPTASHIPIPYVMGFDLQPMLAMEEKRKILIPAVKEGWTLVWAHDPEVAACKAVEKDGRYSRGENVSL